MESAGTREKPKCHKCSKFGRIAKDCNLQQVNFSNQAEETGNLFYASHATAAKNKSDVWYIDSGSNNRLTSREDLLVDINRNIKAKMQRNQ